RWKKEKTEGRMTLRIYEIGEDSAAWQFGCEPLVFIRDEESLINTEKHYIKVVSPILGEDCICFLYDNII
ncbi:hypothetical protein NPIL_69581, partial [Nephila pilipes]